MISRQRALLLRAHARDRGLDDVPSCCSTLFRRGWSNGKQITLRCSGRDRLVEPRDGGLGGRRRGRADLVGPAATAVLPMSGTAAAKAPAPMVLTKSRRETGAQNEHSEPPFPGR